MVLNLLLIILICALLIVLAYRRFLKAVKVLPPHHEHTIEGFINAVDFVFEDILGRDFRELNLNQTETEKRENIRRLIRKNLKECSAGDEKAKEYIKDYIEEIIRSLEGVNEETVDNIIPFENSTRLDAQDKFEILLYIYKVNYGKEGLIKLFENYKLDNLKKTESGSYYSVTGDDINRVYFEEGIRLKYDDKIKIITQRVYQQYRGFGVIDAIREMKIDGVSGGISSFELSAESSGGNLEESFRGFYKSTEQRRRKTLNADTSLLDVWIFYQGKTICLAFLSFPNEKELIRVCKNIYRNNYPGLLSETKGFMVNDMKDGSRVVVFRPPVASGWAFFVRKHDVITNMDIGRIITEENCELVIKLLSWMVKGCLSIVITGEMGSGKTTLLKLLVQFIEEIYPIRVFEQVYELNLNKAYPGRNILSLRESSAVSGQEILNTMKKTDGTVLILGEVASHETANYLVEISGISKMTLCSHHAETTEDFISYLKIAQLRAGGFHNESLAEYQAAGSIGIDIHMENKNGCRYISRITEILPYDKRELPSGLVDATREYYHRRTSPRTFETKDILTFQEGKYVFPGYLSERIKKRICENLPDSEKEEFLKFSETMVYCKREDRKTYG